MARSYKFTYEYANYDGRRSATFVIKDGVFDSVSVDEPRGGGYVFLRKFAESMNPVINELVDIVKDAGVALEDNSFLQSLATRLNGDTFILSRLPHYMSDRKRAEQMELDEKILSLREELKAALHRRYIVLG